MITKALIFLAPPSLTGPSRLAQVSDSENGRYALAQSPHINLGETLTIGPVGLRLDVGQDVIDGHDGLTANASIGTLLPLGKLNIQPAATISWGSSNYNQSFFGVTQEQATLSGLDVNEVDSGLNAYSISAVSWFELNDKYVITLIGSHSWYTGEANDSPILQASDGSDTGFLVSLGFARKFTL
jgi:outer membrane scaffolding protein for murein synthesis (MipA/OmpV family)